MPEFSNTIISLFHVKRAATEQVSSTGPYSPPPGYLTNLFSKGGLLSGKDPSAYNPADPIRLWIIQLGMSCYQECQYVYGFTDPMIL